MEEEIARAEQNEVRYITNPYLFINHHPEKIKMGMTMYQRIQELAKQGKPKSNTGTFDGSQDSGAQVPGRGTKPKELTAGDTVRGNLGGALGGMSASTTPDASAGPGVLQVDPAKKAASELQQQLDDQEKKRPRGRAATLLTGSAGLLSSPNVSRRSLMGF